MSDEHKRAMAAVLHGMGHAARSAKAKRFARRAPPAEEMAEGEAGKFAVGGGAPSPAHDMAELGMTREEMDELDRGEQ